MSNEKNDDVKKGRMPVQRSVRSLQEEAKEKTRARVRTATGNNESESESDASAAEDKSLPEDTRNKTGSPKKASLLTIIPVVVGVLTLIVTIIYGWPAFDKWLKERQVKPPNIDKPDPPKKEYPPSEKVVPETVPRKREGEQTYPKPEPSDKGRHTEDRDAKELPVSCKKLIRLFTKTREELMSSGQFFRESNLMSMEVGTSSKDCTREYSQFGSRITEKIYCYECTSQGGEKTYIHFVNPATSVDGFRSDDNVIQSGGPGCPCIKE